MLLLEQIIREGCLPLGDCMLTLDAANGETGFLYFKEGELIEANHAALWGQEALGRMIFWQIEAHHVTALPLGIKRSLWEPLEKLLEPRHLFPAATATASGRLLAAPKKDDPSTVFEAFKLVAGVTRIVLLENDAARTVFETSPGAAESVDWLAEFSRLARAIGETLGLGKLDRWSFDADRCQIIALVHAAPAGAGVALVRGPGDGLDDFEAACRDAAAKP